MTGSQPFFWGLMVGMFSSFPVFAMCLLIDIDEAVRPVKGRE